MPASFPLLPASQPTPIATWHSLEAGGFALRYLALEGGDEQVWILFHGFGEKIADWIPRAEPLAARARVFLVELPGHGQSGVPKSHRAIEPKDWEHWLLALCRRERIDTCRILGYSLGGRLALASVEVLRERVEELVFVAAEGATPSFWYNLATRTALGRRLLLSMVWSPGWVLGSLRLLTRLGLLNRSLARFAHSQLGTRAQRLLVARSWLALRHLPASSAKHLGSLMSRDAVALRVFAGRHDRVAPLARMAPLAEAVPGSEIVTLEVGHNRLPLEVVRLLTLS